MNLQLTRPIVFFDIEGTGLDTQTEKIIQLSLHKLSPDRTGKFSFTMLINPGKPIPPESTEIHGITDADVVNCPLFTHYAQDIFDFLKGCDVAGFGCIHYDVPLLYKELALAGFFWNPETFDIIDAGAIFKIKESRTLTAAVKFYLDRDLDNAHSAVADAEATIDVLNQQLVKYEDLPTTVPELALFSNYGKRMADVSGKFYKDSDGAIRFNFGPNKDKPALDHPDFLYWMWSKDFPADTNVVLKRLLDEVYAAENQQQDDDGDDDIRF